MVDQHSTERSKRDFLEHKLNCTNKIWWKDWTLPLLNFVGLKLVDTLELRINCRIVELNFVGLKLVDPVGLRLNCRMVWYGVLDWLSYEGSPAESISLSGSTPVGKPIFVWPIYVQFYCGGALGRRGRKVLTFVTWNNCNCFCVSLLSENFTWYPPSVLHLQL